MRQFYVLLAEDNADLRSLLNDLLQDEGFVVKAVEDGQAALFALSEERPDVVVTDIVMPNVNGVELIQWIRGQVDLIGLPIIAMSSYGESIAVQAKEAGATRVIAKPVYGQICYELNRILGTSPQTW